MTSYGLGRRDEEKDKEKEMGKGEREERHTKLPANPPAIKATPINKITRALHAAGPSDPYASPENAECRWDLSRRETTRNPTGCQRLRAERSEISDRISL